MGFRDHLEAEEAELRRRAQYLDDSQRQAEEAKAKHAKLAEALMPEVDDAVAMLRSVQGASIAVLEEGRDNETPFERGPYSRNIVLCWSEPRRKRREFLGWKVFTSRATGPGLIGEWSPGLVCVFIPVEGELQVESSAPSATGPLREYVRGGLWRWEDTSGSPKIAREEMADKTLEFLFELLAGLIAEINSKKAHT